MDKEFAEAFKEEIELDEMKWEVGVVYHQEFKNGDKIYFRADSVQKNKRWKGVSVDEFGGRQKKAKSASADEKQQGWETTPKNEIPKGLKEEMDKEFAEAFGLEIDEGKFKKGDIVIPNMGPHKGEKHKIIHDFGDGSYNITPQKHSRFIKYKQGAAKAKENQLKLVKEEVEEASTYRDRAKDDEKKKKKHFAFGGKKKSRHGESGYGKGEEVEMDEAKGFWAVIDTAKKGEVMAVSTDEKDAYNSIKNSTTSKYDYHYGKDPKTLKVVKVMGSHNQKKAEKMIGTKLSYKEEVEMDEEVFYWYIIKGDLATGKIVYAGNEKQVKLKRHDSRFGDGHVMTKSRKMKKVGEKWKKSEGVSEEIEVEATRMPMQAPFKLKEKKSATGYELYHKDFSSAMQHAYAHAKKKGFVIDPKEIDDKVATGPKKPSSGKTNRYSLKAGRKKVEIQVANLDNKRYELNMYIEGKVTLGEIKKVLLEIPSPNQAAIDAFLKKGGIINDPKYAPVLKKRKKINVAAFQKSFANTKQKEKDADKKAKRHYVSGGGKQGDSTQQSSDYVIQKDIKKFPSSLTSGLKKIISGAKMQKYEIKTRKYGKIPGLGITFPGSTTPKLMIQFDEDPSVRDPNPDWSEKGTDPKTHRKFQMTVWINEASTSKDRETGKIDWYQRKEFEGKTADVVAKRTLQYLKTKVKRLANEEVEIDEAKSKLPPHLAKFFDKDGNLKPEVAARVAKGKEKVNWIDVTPKGYGPKEEVEEARTTKDELELAKAIAAFKKKGGKIEKLKDSPAFKSLFGKGYKQRKMPRSEEVGEGIDIEKASMGAVIKDFQDSDAPQFKGKSDKKRKEMAIAAKLSKEENEDDDPVGKSKKNPKKDKINLKPKMDETMKNYKEFMKKVKEKHFQSEDADADMKAAREKKDRERKRAAASRQTDSYRGIEKARPTKDKAPLHPESTVKEDSDPDTKGTQGDNAEWKKARAGVLKKYGVASCAFIKDDKTKKQCFKDLDDSHVADHEEQTKKEEIELDAKTKGYKDVISRILGRKKEVKEGVTTGGIEYGEQDWDAQHRLENSYPNLHANYAEFHEQGLEGPYLWHGETYFFDRKVGSWYSVTAEDFVDDEISKDLSLAYVKDGMYKRQFAS